MQPLLDARVKLRARHRFDSKYQGLVRITSRLRCPGTRAAEASRLNDDDNLAHFIISRSRPLPKFHEPRFWKKKLCTNLCTNSAHTVP